MLNLFRLQDLPDAMPTQEVAEGLGLHKLRQNRKWFMQATCATNGTGIFEGLDWLSRTLVE